MFRIFLQPWTEKKNLIPAKYIVFVALWVTNESVFQKNTLRTVVINKIWWKKIKNVLSVLRRQAENDTGGWGPCFRGRSLNVPFIANVLGVLWFPTQACKQTNITRLFNYHVTCVCGCTHTHNSGQVRDQHTFLFTDFAIELKFCFYSMYSMC